MQKKKDPPESCLKQRVQCYRILLAFDRNPKPLQPIQHPQLPHPQPWAQKKVGRGQPWGAAKARLSQKPQTLYMVISPITLNA